MGLNEGLNTQNSMAQISLYDRNVDHMVYQLRQKVIIVVVILFDIQFCDSWR